MIASSLCKSLFLILFFVFSSLASAQPLFDNEGNKQTYEIGLMVQALQIAIQSPQQPESLKILRQYGFDRRYHIMIRGWLFETLVAVESQLYSSKNSKEQNRLQLKSDALKKAIRLINKD